MVRAYYLLGRIDIKTKIKINPSILFNNDFIIKVHLAF